MSSSTVRIGLFMALLAPAALPQGNTIFHTNPPSTGTYGKSEFVDLDGDTYPDLVSLQDDEVDVRFALAFCEVIKQGVATGVNDIATSPAPGGDPGGVMLAGSSEVRKLSWDGDAFETTVTSSQGACLVARERYSTGGARRFVVVRPDKRTIDRLTEVTPGGSWSSQLVAVELADIYELESVDTDGDGTPEICAMLEDGVAIRENDGSWIAYHIAPAAQATVTAEATSVVKTVGAKQLVALALRFSDGSADDIQLISTVDESGFRYSTQFVGDTRVTGLAARDTELITDGQGDLSLNWQFDHSIPQLEADADADSPVFNIYAPNVFNLIDYSHGESAGDATGNVAQPALADVDGDGDIDTVLRLQDTQKDFVYLNPRVDEDAMKPTIGSIVTACAYDYSTGNLLPAVQLSFQVDIGAQDVDREEHVEFVVYRKANKDADIEVEPVAVERIPIDSSTQIYNVVVSLGEEPDPLGVPTFDSMYFFLARRVEMDEAEEKVKHRNATRIYVACYGGSGDNYDYIDGLPGNDPNSEPFAIYACEEVPESPPPAPPGPNVAYKDSDGIPGGLGSNGDEPPCLPPPTDDDNPPKGGD